jgi:hypothetical protein
MDEQKIVDQIKEHMATQGVTQVELGRRVAPESAHPGQSIRQYLIVGRSGRSLLTGTGKAILDALGLEVVIRPKQQP